MNRVGKGFDYLRQTFQCINEVKLKEGIFFRPQIKQLFKTLTLKINLMLPRKEPATRLKMYAETFWEIKIRKLSINHVMSYVPHTVPWCATCSWNSISYNPTWGFFFPGKYDSRLRRAKWKLPSGYIPGGKKIQQQMEPKYVGRLLLDTCTGDTERGRQKTIKCFWCYIYLFLGRLLYIDGADGSAVGWGTALQAGR